MSSMSDGWPHLMNMVTALLLALAFIWAGIALNMPYQYWVGLGIFILIFYYMVFTLQESAQTHEIFQEHNDK